MLNNQILKHGDVVQYDTFKLEIICKIGKDGKSKYGAIRDDGQWVPYAFIDQLVIDGKASVICNLSPKTIADKSGSPKSTAALGGRKRNNEIIPLKSLKSVKHDFLKLSRTKKIEIFSEFLQSDIGVVFHGVDCAALVERNTFLSFARSRI